MRKQTKFTLVTVLAIVLVVALPVSAADVFVSTTGQNPPAGDGSLGNPYLKIIDGFLNAADGDRVVVLPGTYPECVFASEFTIPGTDQDKPITLIAKDWEDNQLNTTTIIDGTSQCGAGQIAPDSTVVIGSSASRLEGFTIRGGGGSGVQAFGNTVITNNIIENNTSQLGGGIFFEAATCYFGQSLGAEISNNIIRNNSAVFSNSDGVGGDGGGIYVNAEATVQDLQSPCQEFGNFKMTISGNQISGNTLSAPNNRSAFGGGIFAVTNSGVSGDQVTGIATAIGESEVIITQNVVENNGHDVGAVGYGGGLFVSTYGFGVETVTVDDNDVRLNTSRASADISGDGGGMSTWIQMINSTRTGMEHHMTVTNNRVVNNTSGGNGGGIDMFTFLDDVSYSPDIDPAFPTQVVDFVNSGNIVVGNAAQGSEGGGGGMLASLFSRRTALNAGNLTFSISDNQYRDNTSVGLGGGLSLWVRADAEPPDDPITAASRADIVVTNVLVASNDVTDSAGVGGGIWTNSEAYSLGVASITIDRATIAGNTTGVGAGGIELEGRTDFDQGGQNEGTATVSIVNSILSANEGLGIGGAEPGLEDGKVSPAVGNSGNVTIDVFSTDVFGHPLGDYEVWVGNRTSVMGAGNLSVDPLLSTDNLYIPQECSATIDAADPSVAFNLEPQPNGGRANMGHLGGTTNAALGLVDLTGDNRVDGNEILKVAAAFGTSQAGGQTWFDISADVDGDSDVDGDDLALVSADFAKVCP